MDSTQVRTWQDCLIAQDELIEVVVLKIQQDAEHGDLWQKKLALMLCRRQEILIKVEQEKQIQAVWDDEQVFMQSLQKICDNVLERSQVDGRQHQN